MIEPSVALSLIEGGEVVSATEEDYFNDYSRTKWIDKVIQAEITEDRSVIYFGLNDKGFVEVELKKE
jgi:hypothetical protein